MVFRSEGMDQIRKEARAIWRAEVRSVERLSCMKYSKGLPPPARSKGGSSPCSLRHSLQLRVAPVPLFSAFALAPPLLGEGQPFAGKQAFQFEERLRLIAAPTT